MWFKNLLIYRSTKVLQLNSEQLEQQLSVHQFKPCGRTEMFSYGWSSPLGRNSSQLFHSVQNRILLCARREEKVLPAQVIKELVDDKVQQIEASQLRKVRRKERDSIKEEVQQDLLPRAFNRSSYTFAYIAPEEGYMIIDTASAGKADDVTALLRKSLGSLPIEPLSVQQSPSQVMTAWLKGGTLPKQLSIGYECELRDRAENSGVVNCKNLDLAADDIKAHLKSGKHVVKLALNWNENLSFLLSEDLTIKRLRYGDRLLEQVEDLQIESYEAQVDADFAILSGELSLFIPWLTGLFGGELIKA